MTRWFLGFITAGNFLALIIPPRDDGDWISAAVMVCGILLTTSTWMDEEEA